MNTGDMCIIGRAPLNYSCRFYIHLQTLLLLQFFLFYKQLWSELQTVLAVGKEINAFPCSNWQVRVSQLCV